MVIMKDKNIDNIIQNQFDRLTKLSNTIKTKYNINVVKIILNPIFQKSFLYGTNFMCLYKII